MGKGYSACGREKWRDETLTEVDRGDCVKQVIVRKEEDEQKLKLINDWMRI